MSKFSFFFTLMLSDLALRSAATKGLGATGLPPIVKCAVTLSEADRLFTSLFMEGKVVAYPKRL